MFEAFKARVRKLFAAPKTIMERAAPRIQARFRSDATTRRGNVPEFAGPMRGSQNIPIVATAAGNEVKIDAPAWVLDKANELGQPEAWAAIVREETGNYAGGR